MLRPKPHGEIAVPMGDRMAREVGKSSDGPTARWASHLLWFLRSPPALLNGLPEDNAIGARCARGCTACARHIAKMTRGAPVSQFVAETPNRAETWRGNRLADIVRVTRGQEPAPSAS